MDLACKRTVLAVRTEARCKHTEIRYYGDESYFLKVSVGFVLTRG